jgi:16S rRNA U516 pseudouridylate synthase RsuA-like enzyme
VYLPKVMERWFGMSRSEARRRIEQGGVTVDGQLVSELSLPVSALDGRSLRAGKSAKMQGVVRLTSG